MLGEYCTHFRILVFLHFNFQFYFAVKVVKVGHDPPTDNVKRAVIYPSLYIKEAFN